MTAGLGSDAAGRAGSASARPWASTEPARPAGPATGGADPRGPQTEGPTDRTTWPASSTRLGPTTRPDTSTAADGLAPPAGARSASTGNASTGGESAGGESAGEPERTDAELLRAHVEGDRDAFATLFHRHRDRLWAVALRTVADREEAADALQDALLSAHRSAARFRGEAAVTTWLHRIVVNACLDRIRRRQAHPTVPLPDSTRPLDTARWQGGVEPAAPATDHDTALVVRQALAELPVEQRAALVLVDLQGYSVAEVAEILGVAEGTVKSRCARGRARLAVLLGHLRPGGGGAGRDSTPGGAGRDSTPGGAGRDSTPSPRVPSVTSGNLGSAGGVRSQSARLGADRQVASDRRDGRTDQDQEES